MLDVHSIIDKNTNFSIEDNIFHFILDEDNRPWWSKQLDVYFSQSDVNLNMPKNYQSSKQLMSSVPSRKRFVDFVSDKQGVKVDLASGPSGYFSPILDNLTKDDLFIVTDACTSVIRAHSKACDKNNFYVFDLDLDKKLPFETSSVDVFSGNLLNNVNNYAELIREAYRCLKLGGHLAIIDMFFDYGCETYDHLNSKGEIWASFETFVAFCESVGFTYIDGDIISFGKGKIDKEDLYPLGEDDGWSNRTLYFIKK